MLLPARPRANLTIEERRGPGVVGAATASVLIPGAGQLWQRRFGQGAVQLLSFSAYVIAAVRYGNGWWTLGALLVNVWSAVDAVWWARGAGQDVVGWPGDELPR
jgi:hypothetical protein